MSAAPTTATSRPLARPGIGASRGMGSLAIAIVSAAAFALSGPLGKSLIDAGWSPNAAVLVRVGGGALLLAPFVIRDLRRRPLPRAQARLVAIYGVLAVAGAQVSFFNAVQTLSVGVALLLEYLAPVLLVLGAWVRTRVGPGRRTAAGAIISMAGLLLVLDVLGGARIDPVGVLWGLAAATGLASYFVVSAKVDDTLSPIVLAGSGLAIGAALIAVLGVVGLLPLRFVDQPVVIAGVTTSWVVPLVLLVLVTAVLSYLTGIVATARLGTRVASFVGLSEVLFAVLFAWLLLGELPGVVQLAGGVLIVAGVALVHADDGRALDRTATVTGS